MEAGILVSMVAVRGARLRQHLDFISKLGKGILPRIRWISIPVFNFTDILS
jgi:hypothetical protein